MKSPLLTGLLVTRPASLAMLRTAIGDFARQTWPARELVVVHDGDARFDRTVRGLADEHGVDAIVERVAASQPLGALRNRSVELARGEWVAQWDDDDRHHPQRLERQVDALRSAGADAAFSAEQLHWFKARGTMFWEDWTADPWPLGVVQGTLVAARRRMPRYPEAARGEDSALLLALATANATIARVAGIGWSYVYTYHGGNTWDEFHHAASVATHSLSSARLLAREAELRRRLAEYDPPLPAIVLPCGNRVIKIDADQAAATEPAPAQASAGRKRRASTA